MEYNNFNNNENLLEKGNASAEQKQGNLGTTTNNDAEKKDLAKRHSGHIHDLDLEATLCLSDINDSFSVEDPEIDQDVLSIDKVGNTTDGERLLKEILKELFDRHSNGNK